MVWLGLVLWGLVRMNLIESSDEKVIEKSVCQHKKSSKNKIVFNNIYNISRITKFKIRNKFKVNFQWPFFHSEITFELKDLIMFYKILFSDDFPHIFTVFLAWFWPIYIVSRNGRLKLRNKRDVSFQKRFSDQKSL